MFALLVPAGFALVVKVVKGHGDAHEKHRAAEAKAKAASSMRGAAASVLPDADVEVWRERAALATERIKGLESIITEMSRKLDQEEKAREEAEEVAGEKLMEIDALKSEKERVEATAAEREAELKRTLAEREAEAAASDEAARVLAAEADTASMALFSVSQSILRWREELVVASMEPDNYGAQPSAQQVLDVVADMENEIEVNVVMADALPTELKSKLLAKRAEQVRRKRLEARVCDTWQYGVRSVMDAPEQLARLVTAGAASISSATAGPSGRRAPAVTQHAAPEAPAFARVRTPPKRGKENAGAAGAGAFPPGAAALGGSRPLEAALTNVLDMAASAMAAPAAKAVLAKAAPPSPAAPLPSLLLPGELPGGPAAPPQAAPPAPKYRVVPKAKKGTYGKGSLGDRRAAVAAMAAAFDHEPAVPQPQQHAIAMR